MDPQVTQLLATIGAIAGLVGSAGVIVVALINKFGKGTTDRQTEVQLGVSILEKQIDRADKQQEKWTEIEKFLRTKLDEATTDRDKIRALLETAETEIKNLTAERDMLRLRLKVLASKFTMGQPITMADITGGQDPISEIEDLEDTYMS